MDRYLFMSFLRKICMSCCCENLTAHGVQFYGKEDRKEVCFNLSEDLFLYTLKHDTQLSPIHGIIKTEEAGTLDFSGVPAFFVTIVLIVQCSAAQNVHRPEPYLISSTAAFSSSKVL